jgi:cytochrome c-type biogenesis protein CcmH/NrfG
VFEVYETDSDSIKALKTQTRAEFERAVELFELQKFAEAQRLFESLLQINEGDKAARLYAERSQKAQTDAQKSIWDGVEAVEKKR